MGNSTPNCFYAFVHPKGHVHIVPDMSLKKVAQMNAELIEEAQANGDREAKTGFQIVAFELSSKEKEDLTYLLKKCAEEMRLTSKGNVGKRFSLDDLAMQLDEHLYTARSPARPPLPVAVSSASERKIVIARGERRVGAAKAALGLT